jgi:hypothetical protein
MTHYSDNVNIRVNSLATGKVSYRLEALEVDVEERPNLLGRCSLQPIWMFPHFRTPILMIRRYFNQASLQRIYLAAA